MTISLDEITRISRDVAREDSALELLQVASNDANSERVELLITIRGCHEEPCMLLVNVSRADPVRFERELKTELRKVLAAHRSRPPAL
jgi:hypothetical protein